MRLRRARNQAFAQVYDSLFAGLGAVVVLLLMPVVLFFDGPAGVLNYARRATLLSVKSLTAATRGIVSPALAVGDLACSHVWFASRLQPRLARGLDLVEQWFGVQGRLEAIRFDERAASADSE